MCLPSFLNISCWIKLQISTLVFTNSRIDFYTLFSFLFLSALLHRAESSCSYLGPFQSDHDGNGLHLYRHVSQQRSALLSQASLLLFHPIRWNLTTLCYLFTFKFGNIPNWLLFGIFMISCLLTLPSLMWFYSNVSYATNSSLCTGVLVLLSILIFHQSVLALLSSDHSIPLHHELSWSVACVGSAGAILIFGGFLFIILSLPFSPWQKCLPHKNSAT